MLCMRYIVLIRGINISGRNKVSIERLRDILRQEGYKDVKSYINSGNIILSSDAEKTEISESFRRILRVNFDVDTEVMTIEKDVLSDILKHAPKWWNNDRDKYHNLIFVLDGYNAEAIYEEVGMADNDIDQVEIYDGVIFWSFDLKRYPKSLWWKKTASKGIAEKLTVRNANTLTKIADM